MNLRLLLPLLSICVTLTLAAPVQDANATSSLHHYQAGEQFFDQNNYQSAAAEFRAALNGDPQPKWITAWSHVYLGKIFDVTRQRDRAIRQYNLALDT